jgi:ABC-2 type transport system ATP-binding protein
MSLVEINNLVRTFDNVRAVRGISFSFDAGQIVGFIGPNGAGKSTTMRILATLDEATSGTCVVQGYDVLADADKVRALIGFMPDSFGTYPHMTVLEYLDFFGRAYALSPDLRRQRIADIIDFCQLGNLREKLINTLSKGMRQRLCLGRCLINDPKVLILDEPTAGLDPRARIEFRDLMRVLASQGRAILISSHILSELEESCDSVVIIEAGTLVAQGSVGAVKARAVQAAERHVAGRNIRLEIRLAKQDEQSLLRLQEEPALSEIRDEGHNVFTAAFEGGVEDQAALLKRLIDRGLKVHHFASRAENLEDAFMRLTEGTVQ